MKLLLAPLVVGLCFGCRPKEPPICSESVELNEEVQNEGILPADVWYAILIPGTIRRPELRVPAEPRECSGRQVQVRWADSQAQKLPRKQLSAEDLSLALGPQGEVYVWARTDYYSDGTAVGPVAVAFLVGGSVEVRGVGSLRAAHNSVRLRLEKFGEERLLLLASGKECQDCPRDVYLVPLTNQLFRTAQLVVDGEERGPARYRARELRERPGNDGWVVREEVFRTLDIEDGVPVISEVLQVRDCEVKAGPDACEDRKEHPHRRKLEWRDGSFHTGPSLWEENQEE